MKSILANFILTIQSEWLKSKRTGIRTMSCIFGIAIPLLFFVMRVLGYKRKIPQEPYNIHTYFSQITLEFFADYALPFSIILTSSYLVYIEYKKRGWEFMNTLPISKFNCYFAKYTLLLIYNLFNIGCFILANGLFSYLLMLLGSYENAFFNMTLEYSFQLLVRLFIASFFISGFQYVICVVMPNFMWAIVVGIVGFGVNLFFNEIGLHPIWFPYTSLNKVEMYPHIAHANVFLLYTEIISLIGMCIVLTFGFIIFRKTRKTTILKQPQIVLKDIAFLSALMAFFWYIQLEKQMPKHHRTVIQGTIDPYYETDTIYLKDMLDNHLAEIPIKNNQFKYVIDKSLPFRRYELSYAGEDTKVFFANKDSLYIEIRKPPQKHIKRGTHLVANNLYTPSTEVDFYVNLYRPDSHKEFLSIVNHQLLKRIKSINNIKTANNFVPRDDFMTFYKNAILASYRETIYKYIIRHPEIEENHLDWIPNTYPYLKEPLPYDENLLNFKPYKQAITKQICEEQNIEEPLQAIAKIERGSFKNHLLYKVLLEHLNASKQINFENYLNHITDENLQQRLIDKNNILEKLFVGNYAPDIQMETFDNVFKKLSDLKGKYIVIDVWASWCKPCLEQAYYFNKEAKNYKGKNISFMTLNIDTEKSKWLRFKNKYGKNKDILHARPLHIKNFIEIYNIRRLPKFLLIDPEGKIVDLNVYKPSHRNFKSTLKKILNL